MHYDTVEKGSGVLNKPFVIQPSIRIPTETKCGYEWKISDKMFSFLIIMGTNTAATSVAQTILCLLHLLMNLTC